MNLLFTCAGRRNYLINYFKEVLRGKGKTIAADMQYSAPALTDADTPVIVPSVYSDDYIGSLLSICNNYGVKAIISLNDLELPILSSNRSAFDKIGVKLIVSNDQVIDICFDKWRTVQFANLHGINTPVTYLTLEEAKKDLEKGQLKFPLVVKPRWGSASIGIDFPQTLEELEISYKLLKLRLERTILSEISKTDINRAILIQEKIEGKEFGIDILNNLEGETEQVYVKEKLAMRAGETDKALLRDIPELENLGYKVGKNLRHIGNLDCDFLERDGKYYLLELNPRFGGGYPFSHMAGANYPAAICAWLEGKEYDFSTFRKDYDQPFAKCDTLIKVANS